jgi:hypothetical protein
MEFSFERLFCICFVVFSALLNAALKLPPKAACSLKSNSYSFRPAKSSPLFLPLLFRGGGVYVLNPRRNFRHVHIKPEIDGRKSRLREFEALTPPPAGRAA